MDIDHTDTTPAATPEQQRELEANATELNAMRDAEIDVPEIPHVESVDKGDFVDELDSEPLEPETEFADALNTSDAEAGITNSDEA